MAVFTVTPTSTTFSVQVGENTAAAAASATSATASATSAATSAGNAAATLARAAQPFVTPPAGSSALVRLLEIQLRQQSPAGEPINWPANLSVREIAADGFNRFRFRLGGGDAVGGDGNYPQIGAESSNASAAGATSPGTLNIAYGTFTSGDDLLMYAADTSLGVAKGTVIGTYRVAFDGSTFGTYFPFTVFSAAAGSLVRSQVLPSEVETSNTQAITQVIARDLVDERANSPFVDTYDYAHGRAIIKDVIIDHGVPGRDYVLNIRTDTASGLSRLWFELYDTVRGEMIALRRVGWTTGSEAPLPSYYLSFATIGGVSSLIDGNAGVGATVWLNTDAIVFDGSVSNFTTAAYAIKQDRIWSPAETRYRVLNGLGHTNDVKYVGTGGDYPTLVAAEAAALDRGFPASTDDVQRGWFPFSDTVTFAAHRTIKVKDGYTEDKSPVVPDGVAFSRGLLGWGGLTWDLRRGEGGTAAESVTTTTYYFDWNYGGVILADANVTIDSDHNGAVVHQDVGNALTRPTSANASDPTAGEVRFGIYGKMKGGRYKSPIQAYNAGLGDNEHFVFEDVVFETTGSGVNFSSHNSPANMVAGSYTFRRCKAEGGLRTFNFTVTDQTVNARHELIFEDCDLSAIQGGANAGGVCPFVLVNPPKGVTFTAVLRPEGGPVLSTFEVDRAALVTVAGTSHTLLAGDREATRRFTSSSAVTVTVPTNATQPFPIGAVVPLSAAGTGAVTVAAASGVTIRSSGGLLGLDGQYARAALEKIAADEWELTGQLT